MPIDPIAPLSLFPPRPSGQAAAPGAGPRRSLLDPLPRGRREPPAEDPGAGLARLMAMVGHGFSAGDTRRAQDTMDALTRTGVSYSGVAGGFVIKPEYADTIFDKARMGVGPFSMVNWHGTKYLEFALPVYAEAQRTAGNRWGGMGGSGTQIGQSEVATLSGNSAGPALDRLDYRMSRLVIYSPPITRDLLSDSELIRPMLDYVSRSELRLNVDASLIGGGQAASNTAANIIGMPRGILTSACTVFVKRATGNQIAIGDINSMWAGIYGPCKSRCVWHCSDEVLGTIDAIATTNNWPASIYLPQGVNGNEFPLIKGRPVIISEVCSAIGTQGDLVCADWNEYHLYFHKMSPADSGIAFQPLQPADLQHSGHWGLPEASVEGRSSDQLLFLNDEVVFAWKLRIDGSFCWSRALTNINGSQVGPCAALVG